MASIRKRDRGSYLALWYDREGNRIERATGEWEHASAMRRGNQMEARFRFFEEHKAGLWLVLATMNFSPRYCWDGFSHKAHLPFREFRELLREAGVRFAPPARWKDLPRPMNTRGKRYRFRGSMRTIDQILEATKAPVTAAVLRYRLRSGWDIEEALSTPKLSPAEVAARGAAETNRKRRAAMARAESQPAEIA